MNTRPLPVPSGGQCEEDNGPGCHEAPATAQERDGVHRPGSSDQPLLHRHPQHHPGRGGPHPGKGGPFTLASGPQDGEEATTTSLPTPGPQEPAEDPGKEIGQLHPLGPSQHPGGPVKEVSVPALSPPGQRAHDGQPYQYLLGEQSLLLSLCYWESNPGLQEWLAALPALSHTPSSWSLATLLHSLLSLAPSAPSAPSSVSCAGCHSEALLLSSCVSCLCFTPISVPSTPAPSLLTVKSNHSLVPWFSGLYCFLISL